MQAMKSEITWKQREALGEVFGYVPYPLSAFEAVTVCDDFLGTSYSASLPPLCHPDNITAMRYNDDDCFICTDVITKKTQHGLYRENALASASKYEYFLGPNVAHLRITKTDEPDRPALLIIKDSYAQCLAPFLARHFDIDLIDLRYFRTDATQVLREIVQAPNYAGTLILCNVDTLTADVGFTRLSPEKVQ